MDSNFIYGGLAAVALFAFAKHRRHHHYVRALHYGFGGFDGFPGPCGPFGSGPRVHDARAFGWRGFGRGHLGHFGRGRFLNHLFDRLGTTHGQEEVLKKEWNVLQGALRDAHEGVHGSVREATKHFASEQFDRAALAAQWQADEANVAKVRDAIVTFLEKAHGVLDSKQRETVGRLLERLQDFRRGF